MTARRHLELTLAAERDIARLLDWSADRFGAAARRRYEALIWRAMDDLRHDPLALGTVQRSELGPGLRTYHLRHCRTRARTSDGVVRPPRHLLVYEQPDPHRVLILRVLHDSMDLERRLPGEPRT